MNILILIANVIFFAGYRLGYYLDDKTFTVIAKALSSACFVANAFYWARKAEDKSETFRRYSKKILIGLSLALIADVVIQFNTAGGIVAFMFVQIMYFLAFMEFKKINAAYLIKVVCVTVFLVVFEWFLPLVDIKPLLIPLVIYILMITSELIKSFDVLTFKSPRTRLVIAGSILFFISDFSLQFTIPEFCQLSWLADQIMNGISNAIYYAAQLFLGYSLAKDFMTE